MSDESTVGGGNKNNWRKLTIRKETNLQSKKDKQSIVKRRFRGD